MRLERNGRVRRTIIGRFGKISFSRARLIPADQSSAERLYELCGAKNIYPLDIKLGIDCLPFSVTVDMMCDIAHIAVTFDSYEQASKEIEIRYGVKISAKTVENITDYVGQFVLNDQMHIASLAAKGLLTDDMLNGLSDEERNDVLYVFTDGAMIHIRDKPIDDDKTGDGWMECKNALIIHSSNIQYYTSKNGSEEHKFLKKEYIGYVGQVDIFKPILNALVWRNGGFLDRTVVVISDGASWIHNWVSKTLPNATYILDLFHAKENAGKFAAYVKQTETEKEEYADFLYDKIENGKIDELLELLKEYEGVRTPDGVPNLYTYIVNHADGMDYPSYREKGFFVGSGAMESGNKQYMQKRLKMPGMRWLLDSAERVLALRSKSESDMWDDVECIMYRHFYGEAAAQAQLKEKRET